MESIDTLYHDRYLFAVRELGISEPSSEWLAVDVRRIVGCVGSLTS